MSELTREEVLKAIEPKSDQLNADDLIAGPITVTITAVSKGDTEQPIIVDIEGHRPYKPCKSMLRVMIAVMSDDPYSWIGERLTLYNDPEVKWAGVKVGGIRISHMSKLKETRTFMLTTARGKRTEWTVTPLQLPPSQRIGGSNANTAKTPQVTFSEEEGKYVNDVSLEISCADPLELEAIGNALKTKPKAVQDALRPAFKKRKEQFEQL